MTEVVHETAHPWSSTMIDSRAHQHQSESQTYDPTYRTPTHSRSTSSQSRHATTAPRLSNAAPHHQTAAQTPSRSTTSHVSDPQSSSRADTSSQDHPPSPRLPPTQLSEPTPTPVSPSASSTASSHRHLDNSDSQRLDSETPQKIIVRDLEHIQSFAGTDMVSDCGSDAGAAPQYIISEMSIDHIIEMVAGLLTKITTTNDQHYEHLHRSIPPPDAAASMSPQTTSVLAFHGKNVPSITILQYLGRIQKYCPATYEVFLSLLVYFDRMTERVNFGQMQSLRQADQESQEKVRSRPSHQPTMSEQSPTTITPPSSESMSPRAEPAMRASSQARPQEPPSPPMSDSDPTNLSSFFVVDSFNIHRLVIAGVTCAAKFFSDVFFTNSRYAKVGGLPLAELNHLELQFLLLNDFRLAITVEELDSYATMLVEFYAREVVEQRHAEDGEYVQMPSREQT